MSELEMAIYLHIAGINAKLYNFFGYKDWEEASKLIEDCKTKCSLTKSNKKINLLIHNLIKNLEPLCKQN